MAPPHTIPDSAGELKLPSTESVAEPQKSYEPAAQKRSFEYIIKSGLAGGLAGCAVSVVCFWLLPKIQK